MRYGDPADGYTKHFVRLTTDGFRPERIDAFDVGGDELFAGIWVKRSDD